MIERTPLRRIGGDEDLKGAVFLASNVCGTSRVKASWWMVAPA